MAREEPEIHISHSFLLGPRVAAQRSMHLSIARVMHEHDAIKGGGLDDIPDVFERALGGVISVNQDELDLPVEAVQPRTERLMAIPWMKRDVGKALSIRRDSQIEAVDVA
jgi:hypothetical protein